MLGMVIGRQPGSNIRDNLGSTADESRSMGDLNSAPKFDSFLNPRPSRHSSASFPSRDRGIRSIPSDGGAKTKGEKSKPAWCEVKKGSEPNQTKCIEAIRTEWSECGSEG